MSSYRSLVTQWRRKRILVIGDIILDEHIWGSVSRISPEAPVPVVLQEDESQFSPGGAANVAGNIRSLGGHAVLLGRIGADGHGKILLDRLKKRRINTAAVFVDRSVPTIVKTRILAQHQQVLRVDRERPQCPVEGRSLRKTCALFDRILPRVDAVILSDYGKGMITPDLVTYVAEKTRSAGKILTVDPKVEHFYSYRGVTAITPNRSEAENAIRNIKITQKDRKRLPVDSDRLRTLSDVERAGRALLKFLSLESLLVTLGEDGMMLFEKGRRPHHIHTRARDVFDVTGAGDTVIAVFTLACAAGASKRQAAELANGAAGIVVAKTGPVSVTREELLDQIKGAS